MTRRRYCETAFGRARFMFALLAGVILGACAALPDDAPVVEQLDAEMGATIARLGKPMELYRESFVADPAGRFAFVAPFETNQMGTRELFLWLAIPIEIAPDTKPIVEVNGKELELGPLGRESTFAGVGKSPYKIPTPWSSMYYYKIDAAIVGQLGEARRIAVRVVETTKSGTQDTLFTAPVEAGDPRLKDFAAR